MILLRILPIHISLLVLTLCNLLNGSILFVVHGQEDDASSSTLYPTLMGYQPMTNVSNISMIDIDQQQIENFLHTIYSTYNNRKNNNILLEQARSIYLKQLRSLSSFDGSSMLNINNEFFPFFAIYLNYMGYSDYGHDFTIAGYDDSVTTSGYDGNYKFVQYNIPGGLLQVIQLSPIILSLLQYVIRNLDVAIQECTVYCSTTTSDNTTTTCGVSYVDEAVAYYVGSLQDSFQQPDMGYLLYGLAEKICQSFNTCDYDTVTTNNGITINRSRVNSIIMTQFMTMQQNLISQSCTGAMMNRNSIVQQIFVPLLQGIIRSTYYNENGLGSEYCSADSALYTASILPLIYNCSENDGTILYDQTEPTSSITNATYIQEVLERQYACLGVSNDDIGIFQPDIIIEWGRCNIPTMAPITDATYSPISIPTSKPNIPSSLPTGMITATTSSPIILPSQIQETSFAYRHSTTTTSTIELMFRMFFISITLMMSVYLY